MRGLTMAYPLTIPAILRRTEALFPRRAIVSRNADGSLDRATYADVLDRARRLAGALTALGIHPGDRVATLCWNHSRHLETYFAVPCTGAVLHTLNLRLHHDELAHIATHAGDRLLVVDAELLPLLERFRDRAPFEQIIVIGDGAQPAGMLDYETLLADSAGIDITNVDLDERSAAAMCYTSGTTGRAKGVVYSHRCLVLHAMACAMADGFALGEGDTVLEAVPMFHANAWGLPYTAAFVGAAQILPGPWPDAHALLDLAQSEGVTFSAGVPTLWLGVLQALDAEPDRWDLSRWRMLVIGGAAASASLMRGLERHALRPVTSWGMTELAPVGTLGRLTTEAAALSETERDVIRLKPGLPGALLELRVRNDDGAIPCDGVTMGELETRGAYVASAYHGGEEPDCFTVDGWFRTGDVASIDPLGYLEIRDRSKDLIKSGGEWISSVALEGALMDHPGVAEAAVVAVPHEKWLERPVAFVVPRDGCTPGTEELRAHLATRFPGWWLPDEIVFATGIPRTSTGKFLKSALRQRLGARGHGDPVAP
ncbi:MAG: long-chain fatty acid--CoA ligase [Gemmatimonadales bacterium]|nr:long-chain fatty acid--CoA ligase [Gemmatimonadales bacterium]